MTLVVLGVGNHQCSFWETGLVWESGKASLLEARIFRRRQERPEGRGPWAA